MPASRGGGARSLDGRDIAGVFSHEGQPVVRLGRAGVCCFQAVAERSAASAQGFFDFDDLPPAGQDAKMAASNVSSFPSLSTLCANELNAATDIDSQTFLKRCKEKGRRPPAPADQPNWEQCTKPDYGSYDKAAPRR